MASMYAVYNGPKGVRKIAERVHSLTSAFVSLCKKGGLKVSNTAFFDTVVVEVGAKKAQTLADAAAPAQLHRYPVIDDPARQRDSGIQTDIDTAAVDMASVKSARRFMKKGNPGRAAGALGMTATAAHTPENKNKLQLMFPQTKVTPPATRVPCEHDAPRPPPGAQFRKLQIDVAALSRIIGSFPPGSAAGPSGLTVDLLRQLFIHEQFQIKELVMQLTNVILAGDVPPYWCQYLFGARLIGLVKKDGGLRPVACGEVFRRIAGKAAAGVLSRTVAPTLKFQFGAGRSNGAEAVVHAVHRLLDSGARNDPTFAAVLLDIKNAFNTCSRVAALREVAARCPSVWGYASCAYVGDTIIFFGAHQIVSREGLHQGDPCAGDFFCMVVDCVLRHPDIVPLCTRLELCAAFFDDVTLAGEATAVANLLRKLVPLLADYGLIVSWEKTSYSSVSRIANVDWDVRSYRPFKDAELLGAPLGLPAERGPALMKVLTRLTAKMQVIATNFASDGHEHQALALLRYCASFPNLVYMMRTCGPLTEFESFVLPAIRGATEVILGRRFDDASWLQATFSVRNAGLGLRSPKFHSAIAYIASVVDSTLVTAEAFTTSTRQLTAASLERTCSDALLRLAPFPTVCAMLRGRISQTSVVHSVVAAPTLPAAAAAPAVAPQPPAAPTLADAAVAGPPAQPQPPGTAAAAATATTTTAAAATATKTPAPKLKTQKEAGRLLEAAQFAQLFASVDLRGKARLNSLSAVNAATYLYGSCFATADSLWLKDCELRMLIALRFGWNINDTRRCIACGKAEVDADGTHSLSCVHGGWRTLAHTVMSRVLIAILGEARMQPKPEYTPFVAHADKNVQGLRLDVAFFFPGGQQQQLVDVALLNPLAPTYAATAATAPNAATEITAKDKLDKYARFTDPQREVIRPLIFDMCGGINDDGRKLLNDIAIVWGKARFVSPPAAKAAIAHRVSFALAREAAKLLLLNTTARTPATALPIVELVPAPSSSSPSTVAAPAATPSPIAAPSGAVLPSQSAA